jgi:hypothetical protein
MFFVISFEVFLSPLRRLDHFQDILLNSYPSQWGQLFLIFEDTSVPLLPSFPEDKYWEMFPYCIKNWILKGL